MKIPSERQLFTSGAWILTVLFAYLVIAAAPSHPPDLAQFYLGGKLIFEGQMSELYNPAAYAPFVAQLQDSGVQISDWHFFNRPAFAALPWAVIAALPYERVSQLSLVVNLIGIGILSWKLPQWFPALKGYRFLLICYPPFLWGLLMGQDTAFLTLMLAYSIVLIRSGKPVAGGLLLSLCVVKPHLIWLVPVALFFTGGRRATLWFLGGATALGLLSLAMVGPTGFLEWWALLQAPTTDFAPERMSTLRAIGLQTHPVVGILLGLATVAVFLQACRTREMSRALPVAIVASIILSPHAYAQDASTFAVAAGFPVAAVVRGWVLPPWPAVVGMIVGVTAFGVSYGIVGLGAVLMLAQYRPTVWAVQPIEEPQ